MGAGFEIPGGLCLTVRRIYLATCCIYTLLGTVDGVAGQRLWGNLGVDLAVSMQDSKLV